MSLVFAGLPLHIQEIIQRLEREGYPCYIVGGAVRDSLAGMQPHDYDLCTAALPHQVQQIFADQKVIATGLKHGTVSILLHGKIVEVTTFRSEGKYSDNRRPDEVKFVTEVTCDLARRDFTVNAMAWNPSRGLCDPFGGKADLQQNLLRCVGDPDTRLQEDALRILRALRFVSQHGYTVEQETAAALHRNAVQLAHISAERITSELLQILCGAYVGTVLMKFSDIIVQILPELAPMAGFAQNNPHHLYDVWEHTARAVEGIRPDPLLRLVMLFHDAGKPGTYFTDTNGIGHFYGHPALSQELASQAIQRLRLPARMQQQLLYLVRYHDAPLGNNKKQVRRKLAAHGEDNFRALLAVKKADCIGQGTAPHNLTELLLEEQLLEQVLAEQSCLTRRDLAVNGHDLIAWGVHEGKAIKWYLSEMLEHVLDNPACNTRQQLWEIFQQLRIQQEGVSL